MARKFRVREHPKEDSDSDDDRYYQVPNHFSIRLHHGGVFSKFPNRKYVDGKVNHIDNVDSDRFSVHELDSIMSKLGYSKDLVRYYHYLVPNQDLDFGLHALGSDLDVIAFTNYTVEHKMLNVYTEFDTTTVHTYFCTPSKMVVEEISGDVEINRNNTRLMLGWHTKVVVSADEIQQEEVVVSAENIQQEVQNNIQEDLSWFSNFMDDDFDPFFGDVVGHNNMGDVQKNVQEENMEEDQNNDQEENMEEDQNNDQEENMEEDQNNDQEDEDSDFEDEDNCIDDGDVDMTDFRFNIDDDGIDQEVEDIVEEVLDNEVLDSGSDSDVNESSVRKNMLRYLRNDSEKNSNFYIGQVFGNKMEAKELIKQYAVETRRQLRIVKDDLSRVRAVCWGDIPNFEVDEDGVRSQDKGHNVKSSVKKKGHNVKSGEGPCGTSQSGAGPSGADVNVGGRGKKTNPEKHQCPFVVLIFRQKSCDTWMVNTLVDEHKCLQTRSIKHCTSTFLCKQLMDQIEENPNISVKAVQEQFQRKYEVSVSRAKAYRAKSKALSQLNGDYQSQYDILRDYVAELMNTNPGTTVRIKVEPSTVPTSNSRQFKRIYVCLGSLKQGFKAIGRDFLGLDGAFIKGPYPGQILTAVGIDPNNGIYPLSYAIVEAENLSSWTWFLQCLGDDLDLAANSNFTFISDRQKGILPALAKVFPSAEHRFCLRHIHENMKATFRGKAYKDLLWKMATSTTVVQFEKTMDELKKFNTEAQLWLSRIPPKHWSRSHFSGRAKSDALLNNMCEVFNAKLVDGRDKPIITLLEFIREYLMRRIVNVLRVIDRCDGLLTPTALKVFEGIKKEATRCTVIWNGEDHYQVTSPGGDQCVVDMNRRSCVCRRWEITGMPCKHAVAAIWNKVVYGQGVGLPETFVHPVYTLLRWKKVYKFKVFPINGRPMWPTSQIPTILTPPKHHKHVGRPKKARKKSTFELEEATRGGRLSKKGTTKTCQKCKKKGHNSRSCKGQGEE